MLSKYYEPFLKFATKFPHLENPSFFRDRMEKGWLRNAIEIYENIRGKNGEISPGSQRDFLEFLAFYNSEDQSESDLVESEWSEERWFRNYLGAKDKGRYGKIPKLDRICIRYLDTVSDWNGLHENPDWEGRKKERKKERLVYIFFVFRSSWNEGGFADLLFEEIEQKDARVYSAIIAGKQNE